VIREGSHKEFLKHYSKLLAPHNEDKDFIPKKAVSKITKLILFQHFYLSLYEQTV
jgi:hypothetical protein